MLEDVIGWIGIIGFLATAAFLWWKMISEVTRKENEHRPPQTMTIELCRNCGRHEAHERGLCDQCVTIESDLLEERRLERETQRP